MTIMTFLQLKVNYIQFKLTRLKYDPDWVCMPLAYSVCGSVDQFYYTSWAFI